MRIGTAGWSLPRAQAAAFPGEGQHLQRYARILDAVEIDSSFYRSHRAEVYQRWAEMTPRHFRFAVKLPRTITHELRLRRVREPLRRFLAETAGLGERLGVMLLQLPPSLAFEARPLRRFVALLAEEGVAAEQVVIEPRHASWFTAEADRLLVALHVSRAAADPATCPAAAEPGGWLGEAADGRGATLYYRWHGSPRMYWSSYSAEWLQARARDIRQRWPARADVWCIFDNTAGGAALSNALSLVSLL